MCRRDQQGIKVTAIHLPFIASICKVDYILTECYSDQKLE